MNSGQTIFSQIMEYLPSYEFRLCVKRYRGQYKMKSFSCWDQSLRMSFAQLTYRESLRDIQACLRGDQQKLNHLGIRGNVSRNTLAHANQVRDWCIYADFAHVLIGQARILYAHEDFGAVKANVLFLRSHHHRSLSVSFSWGQVPPTKRSDQAPYPHGFTRQHSYADFGHPRQSQRAQSSRF